MHVRCAFLLLALAPSLHARALPFGKKDSNATIKVDGKKILAGKKALALGSFRVAFVTSDSVLSVSTGVFANGGSAAKMNSELTGIDHATMQRIADEVYADFLKQAAARGITITESGKLAATSAAYRGAPSAQSFADTRMGTLVIPTGQRSVGLAGDDAAKDGKGAATFGSAFHAITAQANALKSPANKAFPVAATEAAMPVAGVTVVVNFAAYKATDSHFGSSKATVMPGATIDGVNGLELNTSLLAWDGTTCAAAVPCEERLYLVGYVHSDAPIGDASKTSSGGFLTGKKVTANVEADPALYEKGVLEVATESNTMLLDALSKE